MQVVVDAPRHAGLAAALDYRCERVLDPGSLVRVPLGRREVAGIVWRGAAAASELGTPLRPVAQQLDAMPPLGPHWMALVEFTASYYQRSMGEVALAALPAELRRLSAAQLAARVRRSQRAADPATQAPAPARCAGVDRRAGQCVGGDRRSGAAASRRAAAAARRDRQRQDRGLSAGQRARAGTRPPGAAAGARDQPDAAVAGACGAAFSVAARGGDAQRPDAGATAAGVAAGACRQRRHRARHAAGGVRVAASARPGGGRRGARCVVQAAGGRALFGA